MENLVIQERLQKLRAGMKAAGVDFYMIPTADFHNSEYVNDYFKVREYFCGFTGSNGTLLVWQNGAGLWTDGRYFVQAEMELEGTGVTLFRMLNEGVPTIKEFLEIHLQEGQALGLDGRVLSAKEGMSLEELLKKKKAHLVYDRDLAEDIWADRPPLPAGEVKVLPEEIAGLSYEEKLSQVKAALKKADAEGFLLSKLDDLMWLFNIRGCDVECNPVALSYAYITEAETILFIQEKALTEETKDYFRAKQIVVKDYAEIISSLHALDAGSKVLVDDRHCSYALYKALDGKQEIIWQKNPTEALKAVKNPVELQNMKEIYLKDSAAVTRFIYWLKKNIGKIEITEITAAEHLEGLRREIPEFLDLSFPTISAYKANAAMMHYEATPESYAVLEPSGMLLVDSGG